MRDFERTGARLSSLSFHAKLAYTVFLAFTVAGVATTALLYEDIAGWSGERLSPYYAGERDGQAPSGAVTSPESGPDIELPAELDELPETPPMATRKLLEVTHFHLFSLPVYLLIVSHLFMMTGFSSAHRTGWIALASASSAVHIAAPWLVRSKSAGAAVVYGTSGAALGVSFLVMSLAVLWGMWRPRTASRRGAAPTAT